nr:MAG TPA: hypothetical protein [Caudoviricetes sp.]
MTKEDIKKALEFCDDLSHSCDDCPYDDVRNCSDTLKKDARELIIEQERGIAQLKDGYARVQEQFAQYQIASDKEIKAQRKQAQIDVLNKLKERIEIATDTYFNVDGGYCLAECVMNDIDELIKEVEK